MFDVFVVVPADDLAVVGTRQQQTVVENLQILHSYKQSRKREGQEQNYELRVSTYVLRACQSALMVYSE